MPRQLTIQSLRTFTETEFPPPEDADYDEDYRVLDLPPGASLREIEDRARLLQAAFHPDGVPAALQARAVRRSRMVGHAADELSQYWKNHGAAPPTRVAARPGVRTPDPANSAQSAPAVFFLASPEGLLAALADALEAGMERTPDGPTAVRAEPSESRQIARQPAPHPVARIVPGPMGDVARRSGALGRSAAVRQTGPSRGAAQMPAAERRGIVHHRRAWSIAGAVLFNLAIVGLVAAAAVRLQQYRADHPTIAAAAAAEPAIATGSPDDPPPRWAGLASPHQPTGAAAPTFAARQR
jgi:hypothetical protein